VRESLRHALDAAGRPGVNSRYLAKLEAVGFLGDLTAASEAPALREAPQGADLPAARTHEPVADEAPAASRDPKRRPRKQAKAGASAPAKRPVREGRAKARPKPARGADKASRSPGRARGAARPGTAPPVPERRTPATLAGTSGARAEALASARGDEMLERALGAAVERGSASAVLLTRRLGVGYTSARRLLERLVAQGLLGPVTPSGAHPVLVTPEEWAASSPAP
jgi:hypothetical protein